jgi:hypothetical protein
MDRTNPFFNSLYPHIFHKFQPVEVNWSQSNYGSTWGNPGYPQYAPDYKFDGRPSQLFDKPKKYLYPSEEAWIYKNSIKL